MPRCVDCANFNLEIHYCEWCNSYIKENSAKRSFPCDGFQRRKKNSGEIAVEKHHEMPSGRLVRC